MGEEPRPIEGLASRLDYRFDRLELLEAALSHASAAASETQSYERLEFLGDRVLGLVMADYLMRHHPAENEGDLARRFAWLVDRNSLAEVATGLELGEFLRLAAGEQKAGTAKNATVLADSMEAVIGAIYRDGGLEAARPIIEKLWEPLSRRAVNPPQDAKTALQEKVQGRGMTPPHYRTLDRTGPDHAPLFTVEVSIEGGAATGEGSSKRAAEQAAAQELLNSLGETGHG
ncbi:MAG: ribonuclease III [Rhodospirillaceae bacterium]|nr:ribonuclease III [Rhodospirillaceae bacterium]